MLGMVKDSQSFVRQNARQMWSVWIAIEKMTNEPTRLVFLGIPYSNWRMTINLDTVKANVKEEGAAKAKEAKDADIKKEIEHSQKRMGGMKPLLDMFRKSDQKGKG